MQDATRRYRVHYYGRDGSRQFAESDALYGDQAVLQMVASPDVPELGERGQVIEVERIDGPESGDAVDVLDLPCRHPHTTDGRCTFCGEEVSP